jgi:hypothetical protein
MKPSDYAWLILAGYVIGWDTLCVEGQTLSDGADHYMLRHPWLTRAVAFGISAHVCNMVPERYDPVHKFAVAVRAFRRAPVRAE